MLGIFQFSGLVVRLVRRFDALLHFGPPLGDSMVMNLSLGRLLDAVLRALTGEEVSSPSCLPFFLWSDLSLGEV